jgi:adenine-specific DNA-methyltransferase
MPTLQWSNRDEAVRISAHVPFRVLEHDPKLSFGDAPSENMLIQGDNLEAAKALLPFFAGRVKCFAVDPPYNTRSAFEHYDDNVEHSTWLSLMYPRLELMRDLLAEDGLIWMFIDDNEGHYLKVLLDEVFGRNNFIGSVTWLKTTSIHNNAEFFSSSTDTIHVYAKNIDAVAFNRIPRSSRNASDYTNPDDDPRGPWASSPLHVSLTSGQRGAQFAKTGKSTGLFPIVNPHGENVYPPRGRCWGYSDESIKKFHEDGLIWWGKHGKNQPRLKRFAKELKDGVVATTFWNCVDVGHNQEAKKELALLIDQDNELFSTPKPERLLQRILTIATNPGDLVCDLFLGSGTAAAVAHKMGRRWIGVEMGEHAVTHCVPRLKKVVEGEQGGISKAVNWQGGGGFGFYRLGPSITDEDGNINPAIRFATLAAHVWFADTHTPYTGKGLSPLLGVHNGTAIYLLYNGILGDRSVNGGNVLNASTFKLLPPHDGPKVVYGEWSQWGTDRLRREGITFKMIPYELEQV